MTEIGRLVSMRGCQHMQGTNFRGSKMRNALIAILLLSVSVTANAQRDKSQTWEWSFAALYQESKGMNSVEGSSLNVDSEVGFGFNIGYN